MLDTLAYLRNRVLHNPPCFVAASVEVPMIRGTAIFGLALAVLLVGAHHAFAQAADEIEICILNICIKIGGGGGGGGGGGHPAPAPLLAAGIPAFMALGGGVLVSRLFRRTKSQA
jgi:hypothetical protein